MGGMSIFHVGGRYTAWVMPSFYIQTLGCKVNQYESEQMAALLRSRGWIQTDQASAQLRIVNSCSVTCEAASKSRQAVRRAVRLSVLPSSGQDASEPGRPRVLVTGCWATSDPKAAASLPGVDGIVTHRDDVAGRLDQLLHQFGSQDIPSIHLTSAPEKSSPIIGTRNLPILSQRQTPHQRAFLKIQDGCDAHCTYCIIPSLRPALWSKPLNSAIEEARRLVDAGHVELVLTGIFLGAYGHATALRRRQSSTSDISLSGLIDALCTRVPGLKRLRLSSLEPGDLGHDLLRALCSHAQVVPHFHLPLQSGSAHLLRRMNRQYTRDDYLRMLDRVDTAFDRPALTTDIIVGFPGETDHEFEQTLQVVDRARFIHIHAFGFSPRPGTAAARWRGDFVHGSVINGRIHALQERAGQFSHAFRGQFVGQTAQLLV